MDPISLDAFFPYRLAVLAQDASAAIARIYERRHGLSTPQWRVMAAVAERPGRSAQDVVRVTPMEKPMVSRAVAALAERGLLRREADQRDGRSSRLFLTATGDTVYADIAPGARAVEAQMLAGIGGAERARLFALIGAMHAGLAADRAAA